MLHPMIDSRQVVSIGLDMVSKFLQNRPGGHSTLFFGELWPTDQRYWYRPLRTTSVEVAELETVILTLLVLE